MISGRNAALLSSAAAFMAALFRSEGGVGGEVHCWFI